MEPQTAAFLAERLGGEVRQLAAVGHGEWSKAFTFEHQGSEYVVRFSTFEDDFAKDRLAARFASKNCPFRRCWTWAGSSTASMPFRRGQPGRTWMRSIAPTLKLSLPALFNALDAARGVDLSASTGLASGARTGRRRIPRWRAVLLEVGNDRPGGRTHGWRDRLAASPIGPRLFESGLSRLPPLLDACPEQRHLVHADLLNYNVLVSGCAVSGVIDWGCSLYGDFLYDVAWFAFWAPWYPAWAGIDFATEAARHYAAIGLDVPESRGPPQVLPGPYRARRAGLQRF